MSCSLNQEVYKLLIVGVYDTCLKLFEIYTHVRYAEYFLQIFFKEKESEWDMSNI